MIHPLEWDTLNEMSLADLESIEDQLWNYRKKVLAVIDMKKIKEKEAKQ